MKSEFYIQHETSPWSVIVFSYDFERSFFGDADLYWDDPSMDKYDRSQITFVGRNAWYWDPVVHGYRPVVVNNSLTLDGRNLLDRLLHVSPPMVNYGL